MDEVQNNSNLMLDWAMFMQKLASGQGVDGEATVKVDKTDSGVCLTVTHAGENGPVVTTYEIPELDEAQLESKSSVLAALMTLGDKVSTATYKEIEDAFAKFCQEYANGQTAGASGVSQHEQVMFDIYDLLRLLQDVGQTLKETAREAREASLQAEMSLIRSEAEIQKEAAIAGFWLSVGISVSMCALSIGFGAVGRKRSVSAYKKEKNLKNRSHSQTSKKPDSEMHDDAVANQKKVTESNKSEQADVKKSEEGKNTEKQELSDKNKESKDEALSDKQDANVEKNKDVEKEKDANVEKENEAEMSEAEKKEAAELEAAELDAFETGLKADKYRTLSTAFLMLSQGLGSAGQSVQQIMTAEGTLLEADQKKADALRDEMSEMMQDAQEVISSVKDLREAIIQSENQAIDTILKA